MTSLPAQGTSWQFGLFKLAGHALITHNGNLVMHPAATQ